MLQCHGIDNEDYWFELYFNPVYEEINRVTGVSISARSISELLKNEFQTRQRLKLERIVSKIAAQLIRSSNNFTKWINEGLKDLCEHLGASSTYIYITDDNRWRKIITFNGEGSNRRQDLFPSTQRSR